MRKKLNYLDEEKSFEAAAKEAAAVHEQVKGHQSCHRQHLKILKVYQQDCLCLQMRSHCIHVHLLLTGQAFSSLMLQKTN